MAQITIRGTPTGTALSQLLMAADITPGADVSYQLCKTIFLYHPLGAKMAESPIRIAQSQRREIAVPKSPESRVVEAFNTEWDQLGCDLHIFNVMRTSRIYGIASIVYGGVGIKPDSVIKPDKLASIEIYFNVLDPLNTAGSLVLNQDPNAPDFQKHDDITVSGERYHRSRSCVILNEEPIYIAYTGSAFGFVGRSVYQRALYPMKSFIQTMVTDDMVSRKSGLIIAKIKQAGSMVNNLMRAAAGIKRNLLKEGETDNVLSIGVDEDIHALDMQNVNGAMDASRTNILKNIATAADMPAKLLENETMVSGFGEGTEDAKNNARYVDHIRLQMRPLYVFFDRIVQRRAWNPEFYATIQKDFPEYKKVSYEDAFYQWSNSFAAEWPSLLTEPDSEKIKVEDIKMKAAIAAVEVLLPQCDPDNKATIIQWLADCFNEQKMLFPNPLIIDLEALSEFIKKQQKQAEDAQAQAMQQGGDEEGGGDEPDADGNPDTKEPDAPKPFAAAA